MMWMGQKSAMPTGAPFAIYYETPETTKPQNLTSKWGMPIEGNPDPTVDVMIEAMPEMQIVTCTYMGDYSGAQSAWDKTMKYAEDNGWTLSSPPMEVYLKGPGETQNPSEWVTEIVLPVMKKQ
jgi:effector-binding domain-containing protein